jgi:hypothetical protein
MGMPLKTLAYRYHIHPWIVALLANHSMLGHESRVFFIVPSPYLRLIPPRKDCEFGLHTRFIPLYFCCW